MITVIEKACLSIYERDDQRLDVLLLPAIIIWIHFLEIKVKVIK